MKTLLQAINELEARCLSSDSKRTTAAEIRANGREESRQYFAWLRQQAPMTAMSLPQFGQLANLPK